MTPEEILARVRHHYENGVDRHEPFTTSHDAHAMITQFLALAGDEIRTTTNPNFLKLFCKRLLQVAGLCVKTIDNLELTELGGPDQCQSPTSPSEN